MQTRGIAMAHTMATASSAASSFLIAFFIMICESLLSSFSDSYFQGLLPAQNQFCRRVRKDAGFLTCPPFASALSANPAHQSGKHQRAAACCIQFGTGPAGRGKFVVGRIGLTGDHKACLLYTSRCV